MLRAPLTVLFGSSGLGKSSLLQAGLFPAVRQQNVLPVYIRLDFVSRHADLTAQVGDCILSAAAEASVEAPAVSEGETLWAYFHRREADFWSGRNRPMLPLLVFDQFEEIFTLGRSDAARAKASDAFVTQLSDLVEGRPPAALKEHLEAHPEDAGSYAFGRHHYKLLLALREDFLPELEGLSERMPSVTHNRMRLQRMNGTAALEVVAHARQLIETRLAEKVVRFVAAAEGDALPLARLEVEPALLSVVCRELNGKRRQRHEARITEGLLEGSRQDILSDFYERSVCDLAPEVRTFIEEKLLTVSGYRDSIAVENALSAPGVTRDALDRLVDRRLLRREEQDRMQRLELTHDLLTGIIAASRDRRRRLEAEELRVRELTDRERQKALLARARSASWLLILSVALAAICIAAVQLYLQAKAETQRANAAVRQAGEARQLADELYLKAKAEAQRANAAMQQAGEARRLADERLQRIIESTKLRRAALSRNWSALDAFMQASPETQMKFRAVAREYPYRSVGGYPTYKFQMSPVEASIPGGFQSIALITYIMDNPTFLNPLITTGPDTKFTGTYDGVGCLNRVHAVIEYSLLDKPLAIAEFDMCQILETIPLGKGR